MTQQPVVLLVDDEIDIRRLLHWRLETTGYQVYESDSGADALAQMRSLQPDAVVMDVVMPDMSGLEVCARMKAEPDLADVPILFLSAASDVPSRLAGLEAGGQDYMSKSTDLREIEMRVKVAVTGRMQRKALQEAARRAETERQVFEYQAHVDALTGLPNRRTLMEEGAVLADRARFSGRTVSVWMVDVDHFKRVNDTLGHAGGDLVLRAVAGRLRAALRDGDICARYGGEEFAVIMQVADRIAAMAAAERVRQALSNMDTWVGDTPVRITVSIGVAFIPEDGRTLDRLLEVADMRLYAAKEAGRNRVVLSGSGIRRRPPTPLHTGTNS